jgi:hypothetical protein
MQLYEGVNILTEPFVALAMIGGLLAYEWYLRTQKYWPLAGASSLFAVAILFKQPAGAVGIALIAHLTFKHFNDLKQLQNVYVVSAVAALLPVGLMLTWFGLQGAIPNMIFWTLTINITGYPSTGAAAWHGIIKGLGRYWLLWQLVLAGLLVILVQDRENEMVQMVAMAFILTAPILFIRQYPHYFVHLIPLGAIVASRVGIAFHRIVRQLSVPTGMMMALIVIVLLLPIGQGYIAAVDDAYSRQSLNDQQDIADEIATATDSEELLILGYEAEYYYLSGKEPVRPNVYYLPVNRNVSYTESSVRKLVTETNREIVVVDPDDCWKFCGSSLHGEYDLVDNFGEVSLYHRT